MKSIWTQVCQLCEDLEAVGLARHYHGDGLAEAARGVQLVEAEHLARRRAHAALRHEAQPALQHT